MDVAASVPEARGNIPDPIEAARNWLGLQPTVALATVVSTWGSSPVPVGGQLAIASDERFQGSVSGGCVEAEVIVEALDVMRTGRPKLLTLGVGDETAWRAGLPCGGRLEVFVEALHGEADQRYLDRIIEARRVRRGLVICTSLGDGSRTVIDEAMEGEPSPEAAACLKAGQSRIVDAPSGRVFLHARAPAVQVLIVGATHIGQALADLARRMDWKVAVVDPRSAFASQERFGDVPRHAAWPEFSLARLPLDARTAVVTVAHVDAIDDEALLAAVRSRCFYVGALGSTRTHVRRVERLQKAGLGEAEIARIHAPVGLRIGSQGPEEIAVSILAEIVKELRSH